MTKRSSDKDYIVIRSLTMRKKQIVKRFTQPESAVSWYWQKRGEGHQNITVVKRRELIEDEMVSVEDLLANVPILASQYSMSPLGVGANGSQQTIAALQTQLRNLQANVGHTAPTTVTVEEPARRK